MKIFKFSLFVIVFLSLISCTKDSENEIPESLVEYKVTLPSDEVIILKKTNNDFIKDENFFKFQEFNHKNHDFLILDLGKSKYHIFDNEHDLKKFYGLKLDNKLKANQTQKKSLINGEVIFYDGLNSTGDYFSVAVEYDKKTTWQLPELKRVNHKYNSDGSVFGNPINMDNKISSLTIKRYALVMLYEDVFSNIRSNSPFTPISKRKAKWAYSNFPDINGNPNKREINLDTNPFESFFNPTTGSRYPGNRASSILVTSDLGLK